MLVRTKYAKTRLSSGSHDKCEGKYRDPFLAFKKTKGGTWEIAMTFANLVQFGMEDVCISLLFPSRWTKRYITFLALFFIFGSTYPTACPCKWPYKKQFQSWVELDAQKSVPSYHCGSLWVPCFLKWYLKHCCVVLALSSNELEPH